MPDPKERLFGFRLVDASALLLFIFSVSLLIFSMFEMYFIMNYYNDTDRIPVAYVVVMIVTLSISIYILYKTLTFRKKRK